MSSNTGTHKRNVQNKRNKGSTGNIAAGGISVRETPASKPSTDELIHVQKDVQFGDNWCKVAVFFAISSALLGVGYYALIGSNSHSNLAKEAPQFNWVSILEDIGFYFNREVEEKPIDEEPSVEEQTETSYLDLLWSYYPFGQNDILPSEAPSETEQAEEVSKESENDKDSREYDSKESADDDKSQDDTDDDENDQDDHESEEDLDEEKNTDGDDDEKDDDDDQKENEDDSNPLDDSENVYEPYKSYNRYSYGKNDEDDLQKDAKDDDDDEGDLQKYSLDDDSNESDLEKNIKNDNDDDESSNESKEQIDRRDQRFNYYHNRDSEEVHKYNYIKGEDEPNDGSEQGGSEKFDSEENTKSENDEDTKKPEDSSHSSEEVERDFDEFPDLKEVPDEPDLQPKEDPPESGNLVTKLSVGIALIFVAYSVIIRKWNNYVNREPTDAEIIFRVASQNDEDLADIAQTIAENILDSINDTNSLDETSEADNKTLQDYLETPSNSANEQSEDDSVNEKNSERDLPMDSENSQTASETEGETDEDSEYEKGDYDRINITNRDDWQYRHQLDDADEDWDRHNIMNATLKYWAILEREPRSIRAIYGLIRSFDWKADALRSNQILRNVIKLYKKLLKKRKVPEALQKLIAERTVDRMKFIGSYDEAVQLLKVMIEKYPEHISFQINLGIIYLILDKLLHAEIVLGKVIQKDPDNGVALVNYGFIMKQKGELEKAVEVLSKGISSGVKDTQDSKFYYHLGEALQRLGRMDEALEFYQKAAEKGIFLSKYQRSLYNVVSLKAKPWWDPAKITNYTNFFQSLESSWTKIRDEVKNMLANEKRNPFRDEAELLREKGVWKQLELFSRGKEQPMCKKFPITCGLVREFAPAAECRRGQVKFSIIEPGTHVWPHCGPTNTRLRAHLGLIVPKNVTIRVAEETRSWHEGKVLLFDDSFEHEIWHNGTSSRLVLIVDVWHPNLDKDLRKTLTPI